MTSLGDEPARAAAAPPRIAVVVPCYRVKAVVTKVIDGIGPEVWRIYCVDDACPEQSGRHIEEHVQDPRVVCLFHEINQGVGGAMLTGYRRALEDGATVVVKLDGDGQMDPGLLSAFVGPILAGECDYTKGNRFYRLADVTAMPWIRMLGNAALSFMSKASSGYWNVFDPTNGYTAIHASVLAELPLDKIAKRYFFESDMLFHLGTLRAVVRDVPQRAVYGDEKSSLVISRILVPFFFGHVRNGLWRLVYTYLLREFAPATLEILLGLPLVLFGLIFGITQWIRLESAGELASSGTVMLAALPVLVGFQLLLAAVSYDVQNFPRIPLHPRLRFSAESRVRTIVRATAASTARASEPAADAASSEHPSPPLTPG